MRQTVVQIECSRCHRKEHLEVPPTTGEPVAALMIFIEGQKVAQFDDLCTPCQSAVKGYIENLTKPMEKKSPDRKKKKTEEVLEEAAAAKAGEPTIHNGEGAKKEGAHVAPHPPVVRRAPSV